MEQLPILDQLAKLQEDFEASNTAKATLESTLAELNASVASKDELLKASNEEIAAKAALLDELTNKVSAKDESLAAIQAKVDELTANAKSAEEKAIEIVANQGLSFVPKVDSKMDNSLTPEDARAEYTKLQAESPAKAGEYFQSHMALIFGK